MRGPRTATIATDIGSMIPRNVSVGGNRFRLNDSYESLWPITTRRSLTPKTMPSSAYSGPMYRLSENKITKNQNDKRGVTSQVSPSRARVGFPDQSSATVGIVGRPSCRPAHWCWSTRVNGTGVAYAFPRLADVNCAGRPMLNVIDHVAPANEL